MSGVPTSTISHHQLEDVLINGIYAYGIYTYVKRFDFYYKASSSAAVRADQWMMMNDCT